MTGTCAECGKRIVVFWPEFYKYRVDDMYYCGETCWSVGIYKKNEKLREVLRKMRKKKVDGETTQRENAVAIAIDGGDPVEYLRMCGSKSPDCLWRYYRSAIKKEDPELFAKIPVRKTGRPKMTEKAEKDGKAAEQPKEKDDLAGFVPVELKKKKAVTVTMNGKEYEKLEGEKPSPTCCQPAKPSGVTVPDELATAENPDTAKPETNEPEKPKISKPMCYDGLTVRTVEGEYGTYNLEKDHISGKWILTVDNGADMIQFEVDVWPKFLEELKKAAKVLGAEI